jgi:hypothetical protein
MVCDVFIDDLLIEQEYHIIRQGNGTVVCCDGDLSAVSEMFPFLKKGNFEGSNRVQMAGLKGLVLNPMLMDVLSETEIF